MTQPRGRLRVSPGQTIQSAPWGNAIGDQSVQAFRNDPDRGAQFPDALPGAVTYLADTGQWYGFSSGKWIRLGGAPSVLTTTTRTVDGTGPGGGLASFNALGVTIPVAGLLTITAGFRWSVTAPTNAGFRLTVDTPVVRSVTLGNQPANAYDSFLEMSVTVPISAGTHSVGASVQASGTAGINARVGSYLDAFYTAL